MYVSGALHSIALWTRMGLPPTVIPPSPMPPPHVPTTTQYSVHPRHCTITTHDVRAPMRAARETGGASAATHCRYPQLWCGRERHARWLHCRTAPACAAAAGAKLV